MSRRTGFPPAVVQLIDARSSGCCEVLGVNCQHRVATIHHRRPRGSGGTRRADTNLAANGLAVCAACHTRIEVFRGWALDNGFLVRQSQDPSDVPVWWRCRRIDDTKRLVYLDNAGGMCDEQLTRW